MKEKQFSITIQATREKVWHTLWNDETFSQWAGIIDPGTHLVGELKESGEIQFISGNGYGVTSLVEELIMNKSLRLVHEVDTKNNGLLEREKQWTGGKEQYLLSEDQGVTTLLFTSDIPEGMEEYFEINYPKALACIKILAEQ